MCVICKNERVNSDKELNCSNCSLITCIPPSHSCDDTFINLKRLDCYDCLSLINVSYSLINLNCLNCFNCPLLTSIPNTLVNLIILECSYCPLLTSIPNTLVNLGELNCCYCPLLTNIPNTLVNLIYLDCRSSSLITSISNNIKYLECENCPWIDKYVRRDNIRKLITLQRFVKRNLKYWIFSRWIKSRGGVEWIYHPDNIGGKIAKKRIEKMFI
jgi:hypothetical protein